MIESIKAEWIELNNQRLKNWQESATTTVRKQRTNEKSTLNKLQNDICSVQLLRRFGIILQIYMCVYKNREFCSCAALYTTFRSRMTIVRFMYGNVICYEIQHTFECLANASVIPYKVYTIHIHMFIWYIYLPTFSLRIDNSGARNNHL